MVESLRFAEDRPTFHLLNVGETHYPYALPHEDASEWPHLPGFHGVVKRIDDPSDSGSGTDIPQARRFDQSQLDELRLRQVKAVEYLDGVFGRLFEVVPRNTWIVVTSDHGELFGEEGYFGHGPIAHEKVLEVPFVEGLVP
jgi:arylsulfatase A-like enzyme